QSQHVIRQLNLDVIFRQARKIRPDQELPIVLTHLDLWYPLSIKLHAKWSKILEEVREAKFLKVVEQPFHVLREATHHPERIDRLRRLWRQLHFFFFLVFHCFFPFQHVSAHFKLEIRINSNVIPHLGHTWRMAERAEYCPLFLPGVNSPP